MRFFFFMAWMSRKRKIMHSQLPSVINKNSYIPLEWYSHSWICHPFAVNLLLVKLHQWYVQSFSPESVYRHQSFYFDLWDHRKVSRKLETWFAPRYMDSCEGDFPAWSRAYSALTSISLNASNSLLLHAHASPCTCFSLGVPNGACANQHPCMSLGAFCPHSGINFHQPCLIQNRNSPAD